MEDDDIHALIRQQQTEARAAVREFVAAAQAGDLERFAEAIQVVEIRGVAREAMVAVGRLTSVALQIRQGFLRLWIAEGDGLRSDVNDDLALFPGLRALLPPYRGPALTLYRGDSFFNRCRRTYGMSWSTQRPVAEAFGMRCAKVYERGGVLLQVDAPPEAIVAVVDDDDRYEEREIIVDRRRLRGVRVLERYLP